jgi:hypothetical protein
MPRLIVRTQPAHVAAPRYRAGLGPFGREPVEIVCTEEQARDIAADPALLAVRLPETDKKAVGAFFETGQGVDTTQAEKKPRQRRATARKG